MISKRSYRFLVCCLVSLLLVARLVANTRMPILYNEGNELYAKEKYKEAAIIYQKIINNGYQSPALYFNLANAFYKMNAISSAILNYERALKLAPRDADIRFNLQMARAKTSDKIEEAPHFFLDDWWAAFILFLPVDTLAVCNLLLLFLGLGLLAYYLFSHSVKMKKIAFFSSMALICLSLFSGLLANRQVSYIDSHSGAILFSSVVNVKSSPDTKGKSLFILHEGSKVEILQRDGSWVEIQLPNGNKGWIPSSDMQSI